VEPEIHRGKKVDSARMTAKSDERMRYATRSHCEPISYRIEGRVIFRTAISQIKARRFWKLHIPQQYVGVVEIALPEKRLLTSEANLVPLEVINCLLTRYEVQNWLKPLIKNVSRPAVEGGEK